MEDFNCIPYLIRTLHLLNKTFVSEKELQNIIKNVKRTEEEIERNIDNEFD